MAYDMIQNERRCVLCFETVCTGNAPCRSLRRSILEREFVVQYIQLQGKAAMLYMVVKGWTCSLSHISRKRDSNVVGQGPVANRFSSLTYRSIEIEERHSLGGPSSQPSS